MSTTSVAQAGSAVQLPDGSLVGQVGTTMNKWVDDFGGSALDLGQWDVFDGGLYTAAGANVGANGAGVAMGGYSVSASTLLVNMGVTANAELDLLSKDTFTSPVDVQVSLKLSQAIANNSVYLELIEVSPQTGLPRSHATVAGEVGNRISALLGGAASTTYILDATVDDSPNANNVTTGSGPAWTSDVDVILEARPEDTWLAFVNSDTSSAKSSAAIRLSRQVPDPNKLYKLRLRFKNGAVAPATATTVTLYRVLVKDVQEIQVEIASGRGDTAAGKAVPVVAASTFAIQGTFAHDAAAVSQPIFVGGRASNIAQAAVSNTGDTTYAHYTMDGKQVVQLGGVAGAQSIASITLGVATETNLFAAQATARWQLVDLFIRNDDTIAHTYYLRDGTAGNLMRKITLAAGAVYEASLPATGLFNSAQNRAWTIQQDVIQTTNPSVIAATAYTHNAGS